MKKIIFILFLFCLLFSCYYIYNATENSNVNIVLIGDNIADNIYLKNICNVDHINNDFINNDYRLTDLVNIIKYNQELNIDNKNESIHLLLDDANIVFISIGMNDLYYKLNSDTKEIYTYLNTMIENYKIILNAINRYEYDKVYIMGYYNIYNRYNDIFSYINYKLRKMTNEYGYEYLDLNMILKNNSNFYLKFDNFYLNNAGYRKIYELIVENLDNC